MSNLTNPLFNKWWNEKGKFRFGDVLKEFAAEVFQAGTESDLPEHIKELMDEAESMKSRLDHFVEGSKHAIRMLTGEKR